MMIYIKKVVINSTISPNSTNRITNKFGVEGKYFIKGLIDDPVNLFFVYLFTIDMNVASGTFGVFKIDFTSSIIKYVYTELSMSSGQYFSVNSIIRTSLTNGNDFHFAGKAQTISDDTSS